MNPNPINKTRVVARVCILVGTALMAVFAEPEALRLVGVIGVALISCVIGGHIQEWQDRGSLLEKGYAPHAVNDMLKTQRQRQRQQQRRW